MCLLFFLGGCGCEHEALKPRQVFDPLNQGDKGTAKPLEKKTELSPEEKLREMEKVPCSNLQHVLRLYQIMLTMDNYESKPQAPPKNWGGPCTYTVQIK